MKRLALWAVVAGMTLWIGCTKLGFLGGIFPRKTYEVQISKTFPTPGVQDCTVDNKAPTLHAESFWHSANRISWCVQTADTTPYIIHFTDNNGNNSPFSDNNFQPNCSQYRSPLSGKPKGDYDYQIQFATAHCSDPKVILK
jgi:hypothetical protein